MAELAWGASTHPGQIRPDNEDHLHASNGVYVVADGMGGHEAGEVASQLAVERIRTALTDDEHAPTAERVVEAITNANGDIFSASVATPGQAGMGTTVTVIAVVADPMAGRGEPNIDENDPIERAPDGTARITPIVPREKPEALVLANVGDSRTYLYRHDRLRRITVDHSYVQELVSTGHITDDEARTHPRRNIITRALGIEPDVKVDWWTLPLVRGDRFLLCSDGLVDEVDDAAITATLRTESDPQKAVDTLVDQANAAGGRDNITVIVVDVLSGDDPPDPTQEIDLIPTWADDPLADDDDEDDDADDPASGRKKRRRDRHQSDAPGLPPPVLPAVATGPAPVDADETDEDDANDADDSLRPKITRAIVIFIVLALLIAGFVAMAAWARRGYFVDFDEDDQVVVYQGRPGGLLWFDPTAETTGGLERDELTDESAELVDEQPTFSSLADATEFVRELDIDETATTDAPTTEPPTTDAS
jgi:protein phosphatase